MGPNNFSTIRINSTKCRFHYSQVALNSFVLYSSTFTIFIQSENWNSKFKLFYHFTSMWQKTHAKLNNDLLFHLKSLENSINTFYWCFCSKHINQLIQWVNVFATLFISYCSFFSVVHCVAIDFIFFSCFQFTFHYDFSAIFCFHSFFFISFVVRTKVCNSI